MSFRRIWRRFRDGGGFWLYELDGTSVKSVTRLLGDSIPKPNLVDWSARMAAEYAADHVDEIAGMDRNAAVDTIKEAHNRVKKRAGVKGTAIHEFAQRVAAGEKVEVPDDVVGYVDAYLRFVDEWHPEFLATEGAVASRKWRYGGTFDILAALAGHRAIIDIKTGGSGVFRETCLQLAAYRHAEVILDAAGREGPMPATEAGYALWLTDDGTYELLPMASGVEQFGVFLHAAHVAGFMEAKHDDLIGLPAAPPAEVTS